MAENVTRCPVCSSEIQAPRTDGGRYAFDCPRCGRFDLSDTALILLTKNPLEPLQIANASGFLRENPGVYINSAELDYLRTRRTPTVAEKATKLLRFVVDQCPSPGDEFHPGTFGVQELTAIAWAKDAKELSYVLVDYLTNGVKYLQNQGRGVSFSISPAGWAFLDSLHTEGDKSQSGFVAMWFHSELLPVWSEAIAPGIEAAGYEPIRIDKQQHNNRIDDEIEAMVRACKFLVADFTGQRGGVYYEAGLAKGLGKPVIWLCRDDDLKNVHFDNRQYNFIVWKPDAMNELRENRGDDWPRKLPQANLASRAEIPRACLVGQCRLSCGP